jgi:hypothetical protein
MKKKTIKRRGVSRRDFLKSLGGAAVGTGVISSGFFDLGRAAQPTATVDIPGGLQENLHFTKVKGFLQTILNELTAANTGARRVVSRLNRSGTDQASPVFVGVVEDAKIIDQRRRDGVPDGDVGKLRFKDANPSIVYSEAVNRPAGESRPRRWGNGDDSEKTIGAKQMGKKANCVHQKFTAIRVAAPNNRRRHIGTITVGFDQDPTGQKLVDFKRIMEKWARSPQSEYIKYLQTTFNLGGPTV